MVNQGDEVPVSPLKKLKILSEQQPNVQKASQLTSPLKPVIEEVVREPQTDQPQPDEPLLQESGNKYVIFPIDHDDMWQMYKELVGNFWSVTETIQQLDRLQLNVDETQYMKYYSSIFASPDSRGLVIENFAEELCELIQVTEAKFFYGHQLMVQDIHYEMYNKLLDNFTLNAEEKMKLFKVVESYDSVMSKREWINQWKTASFNEKIMASAVMHGLMFTSLETTRDWLKSRSRNSLHDLIDIFDRMIYDQELQRDFSCLMLSHLRNKPSKERMIEVINQAAKVEFDFLMNGVKSELIGVSGEDLIRYIDNNTKLLKQKLFSLYEQKKKVASVVVNTNTNADTENRMVNYNSKENHQKLVFDDDF